MATPIRKAVFPIGGRGTRFLPATKAVPKEMLPVVDKPLLQYAVEEAFAAGIEQLIFVTSRGKSTIEDHFDRAPELEAVLESGGKTDYLETVRTVGKMGAAVCYLRQPEPLGLGHAVWCARNLIGDEPFAVLLPDDMVLSDTPCMRQMVDAYHERGGNMVAVMDVPRDQTNRYGILDVGADDGRIAEVRGLVEKPDPKDAPSTLSIIGRYILQPGIFAALDRHERGAGNEIQLTDAMALRLRDEPFFGLRFEGTRYDCGNQLGFLQANLAYALQRPDLGPGVAAMIRDTAASLEQDRIGLTQSDA